MGDLMNVALRAIGKLRFRPPLDYRGERALCILEPPGPPVGDTQGESDGAPDFRVCGVGQNRRSLAYQELVITAHFRGFDEQLGDLLPAIVVRRDNRRFGHHFVNVPGVNHRVQVFYALCRHRNNANREANETASQDFHATNLGPPPSPSRRRKQPSCKKLSLSGHQTELTHGLSALEWRGMSVVSSRRFMSRNIATFCAIAVLLPAALLFWLQIQSLQRLRAGAKLAVEHQVRQDLEILRGHLEARVRLLAGNLAKFDAGDLTARPPGETAAKFPSVLAADPAISRVFAMAECACAGPPQALVSTDGGRGWERFSDFEKEPVAGALSASRAARPFPGEKNGPLVYYQPAKAAEPPTLYVFRYLTDSAPRGSSRSLTALAISPEALLREAFEKRGSPALAVAVNEAGHGMIFVTEKPWQRSSASIHAGFLFPLWTLEGYQRGTSLERLAEDQFRNGLLLTGAVLCCLILALALSVRAMARESRLSELKSAFVSNVSHEMKTPLSLIRLYSETLELGRVRDPGKLHEYHRIIHQESRRLTELIERVLDFARMEAGRKRYDFELVDLGAAVQELLASYRDHLASAGFEMTAEIEHPLPATRVDRNAISQALLNLLDNAVKYSGGSKELSVSVKRRGSEIAIEVEDRGIGIPAAEQQRIFEKFYRVNTSLVHDTKGSGLGLTLAKHIVEAHGGCITVESRIGVGSRFTICLPLITETGRAGATQPSSGGLPIGQTAHR